MNKQMLPVTVLGMFCVWTQFGVTGDKARAAAPASSPASISDQGYCRSERTMDDIKEAEAALKEQWRNEAKTAGNRFKSGTYLDPNGYVWKYGMTLPAKMEAGVKYPLFIGNMGWALAMSESQAQYPCYILNCSMPETLFRPTQTGFDAPRDYKSVTAAAIKAVIDKLLAEDPSIDASRVYIEGASKFGALAWISAYNYPDTYAAIVPSVAGLDISKAFVVGQRKIGIWMYYGVLDGGEIDVTLKKSPHGRTHPHIDKALRDAGYDCVMTVYTHGDHHEYGFSDSLKNPQWNDFTQLRKWLFAQKKSPADWPVISGAVAAHAAIGQPFSYKITASHGPQTFGAVLTIEHAERPDGSVMKPDQDLPKGLTLDPKTGVLSGTPGEAGRFFIRLTATNDKGVGVSTLLLAVKDR